MGDPLISVIIPTYNSEEFIAGTLTSVFSQDYANFEVIVSDDGSQDKTLDIVRMIFNENKHVKARLLENEHSGPGGNRNQGILAAQGEWVAFLDSDDLWYNHKLSKVVESISNNPDVDLWCHSEIMKLKSKEVVLEHYKKSNLNINQFISMYRGNSLSTSAVIVKKDLLLKVGLFDADSIFSPSEDFELWLRLAKIAKIGYIEDILGVYLPRKNSISSDPIKLFKALMYIAQKYHHDLKNISKFYFIEEMRFKGKAFSAAGLGFISQRKFLRGLIFLAIGVLLWPFRGRFLKHIFTFLTK